MSDRVRILAELSRRIGQHRPGEPLTDRLCAAAVDLLGCAGGAITLAYTEDHRLTVSATDPVASSIEGLQDVVQQGPGVEAYTASEYRMLVVDVGDTGDQRWPLLEVAGLDGDRPLVIHAVPMRLGQATVGVLTLWERGRIPRLDTGTSLLVARIIAVALSTQLEQDGTVAESWGQRAAIHQAEGYLATQLRMPAEDALALLRAQAYVRGQSMTQTARDIIERRLTLSGEPDEGIEAT